MFLRVLLGSLRRQQSRFALATLAVLLGSALVSALFNLSFDVESKAGRELLAYGANIMVLPEPQTSPSSQYPASPHTTTVETGIPQSELAALNGMKGVVGYAPYLYVVAEVAGQPLVVAGVDFERTRAISPWWRVSGKWPSGPDEAVPGATVAQGLGLAIGDRFTVKYGQTNHTLKVSGILATGGPEENQIFLNLPAVQTISGRIGEVGLVQVSALAAGSSLNEITTRIENRLPNVQARPLQQFAEAEEGVLEKIRLLMGLAAGLILLVAALTVGSTMMTAVLERRMEIGLMKALGASERKVVGFFLAEGVSVGISGGLSGFITGLGAAALIGRQVFQAAPLPNPWGLPVSLGISLGVGLLASLWPVRSALKIDAAVSLRGE
ncbi:MAG: FtsX-like permease family protein [Spirochaetota bacterium]